MLALTGVYLSLMVFSYLASWGLLKVPFALNYIVKEHELFDVHVLISYGMLTSIVAYYSFIGISSRMQVVFRDEYLISSWEKFLKYFFNFVLLALWTYIGVKVAADRDLNYSGGIERILEFRGSHLLILLLSLVGALVYLVKDEKFFFVNVLFISIMFAIFDGSRVAVIPSVVLLSIAVYMRSFKIFVFSAFLTLTSIYLYDVGRVSARQFEWDLIFYGFDIYIVADFLSYIFAYSVYHVADVLAQVDRLEISSSVFIYGLIPIPSAFFSNIDISQVRLDVFRPIGAIGEMLIFYPLTFFLYSLLIGVLFAVVKRRVSGLGRFVLNMALVFIYLMSYQYGLRTIQWFIWPIVLFLMCLGSPFKMFLLTRKRV